MNYATPEDSAPTDAPAGAIWQPMIRARDLPAFVEKYERVVVNRVDGVILLNGQSVGLDVEDAFPVIPNVRIALVSPSGRIWVDVGPDVPLSISVHPQG